MLDGTGDHCRTVNRGDIVENFTLYTRSVIAEASRIALGFIGNRHGLVVVVEIDIHPLGQRRRRLELVIMFEGVVVFVRGHQEYLIEILRHSDRGLRL